MSTVPCALQCGGLCDETTYSITSNERWVNLKKKALLWSGLDKFWYVNETVDWDKGPVGQYVHAACRLTLCNTKNLEQAIKDRKTDKFDECVSQHWSLFDACSLADAQAVKRLRSSLGQIDGKTTSKICQEKAHGMRPKTDAKRQAVLCRTWSHACKSSTRSRSIRPHKHSAP